ncbi:pilus assembly protein [Pseudomonas syringae pv. aptata]|jgi:Flp pilus assembly protein TadG|uniref:TadE/TadG family type IV pilus assembly protein n=1 Tax=Pseudomonas syringae TaxID=317 RepID=UPI0002ADC7C8|nr:TadE/TadG family type IV pilus assembly protein [Pseudomonas syringae]ELS41200.1 Putative Flp pilus assembly protein TadE [Pseudomonas syringae pv. syringae B64]KZL36769.1 pilus assembly protein TadE [Pseudomonas syringae pv. syringae]MBI6817177.1 pilus assembly protein [Pseudomonas syringae]MBI6820473.1 pilus assembly protein [Pseudomonas syringae]MCK0541444.1 pilus assembly protein [Pseudomonas syringae pv. aptata]
MKIVLQHTLPRRQQGAAAIEFSAVFVIFFAVFYGMVSYSLPLLMVQSFNAAASEAVRRSVALSPTVTGYNDLLKSQAQSVVMNQLSWIPPALGFNINHTSVTYSAGILTVTIQYPKTRLAQVLPLLTLPGIGEVPRLPNNLTAQASLQLVP